MQEKNRSLRVPGMNRKICDSSLNLIELERGVRDLSALNLESKLYQLTA